jgi:hypothetical protein
MPSNYAKKNLMLTAYLSTNHWIAVAIILKQQKVYYLDPLKTINSDTDPFERIINEQVIYFLTRGRFTTNCAQYIN